MASPVKPQVSLLFPEQHEEAAVALGRAFIDDPPCWVILPEPKEPVERARRLAGFFSAAILGHRRQGLPVFGIVADGKVVAAAVTEGSHRAGRGEFIRAAWPATPRLLGAVGPGGATRALRILEEMTRNHPPRPHLYLAMLGVDPDYQKRHFGIALLDHLTALAAARPELAGVYLETATMANVAYYRRAGYEVLGELAPLGIRMWRMLQPRRE